MNHDDDSPAYRRGVNDAFGIWKDFLRRYYGGALGNFTAPHEFVAEMDKHIGRMEDAALARVLHACERENLRQAVQIVRFYMGRKQ